VLPLESAESFTLIVLNGIARLLVTVRFLTTDEACAGVLGATEGVADAVAGTIAVRVAVAVGVAPDPQALIISRPLTANVILKADFMPLGLPGRAQFRQEIHAGGLIRPGCDR
jgi:hypothetical protein